MEKKEKKETQLHEKPVSGEENLAHTEYKR